MKAVLYFNEDGTGHCFYTEAIPLQELGLLTVKRTTQVKFNENSQCWEVLDLHDEVVFEHPSRQACLDWEQEYFNR